MQGNIMVDIRVLWVMDVYAGAGHTVDEMTTVSQAGGGGLPCHANCHRQSAKKEGKNNRSG